MNHPKKFLAKNKEEYQNQIQVMTPVMKKFQSELEMFLRIGMMEWSMWDMI